MLLSSALSSVMLIIILKINYEDKDNPPSSWHWPTVIGCDDNCVEVMNYGGVEEISKVAS